FSPVSGFVRIRDDQILKKRKTSEVASVICNPSTGQSLTLPKMNTKKRSRLRSFFGFDPIEETTQGKAHQVLTLGGDGNLTWRMTNCSIHHSAPGPDCICLNGVLYYTASASNGGDSQKHVWSRHIYKLPPTWKDTIAEEFFLFVGVTGTHEIVLSPYCLSHPFNV
ncbi:hypothetical protein N665_1151s0016, partial [Sinapis alba]